MRAPADLRIQRSQSRSETIFCKVDNTKKNDEAFLFTLSLHSYLVVYVRSAAYRTSMFTIVYILPKDVNLLFPSYQEEHLQQHIEFDHSRASRE